MPAVLEGLHKRDMVLQGHARPRCRWEWPGAGGPAVASPHGDRGGHRFVENCWGLTVARSGQRPDQEVDDSCVDSGVPRGRGG
jgi:hypothetical protein